MKKISLLALISFSAFLVLGNSAHAAELKPIPAETKEKSAEIFGLHEDSDTLLRLADGGYLHGEAYLVSASNPNEIVEIYNSDTDPRRTTVGEVKQLISAFGKENPLDKPGVSPRVSTPPPPSNYVVLKVGAYYESKPFSGTGWQFSGFGFRPIEGSGEYLLWQTFIDDGNIGGPNQAHSTWGGFYRGQPLYVSEGRTYKIPSETHPGAPWLAIYYSHNPINGSRYYVANI